MSGRGRPPTVMSRQAVVDLLAAVASGESLPAATQRILACNASVVRRCAKRDPEFKAQLEQAKAEGRLSRLTVIEHGTGTRYTHFGCRCALCREANTLRARKAGRERASKPLPPSVSHGTNNAYTNYRCRCGLCREAGSVRNAMQRQARRVNRSPVT